PRLGAGKDPQCRQGLPPELTNKAWKIDETNDALLWPKAY
ncbi:hypothetical protein PSYPI_04179, partial [Pseudomonas syringae pv. pisi str. 1704B]